MDFLDWACGNFDASLLPGTLRVGRLSQKNIKENLHGLLRLLVYDGDSMDEMSFNDDMSSGFDRRTVGSPPDRPGFGEYDRRGVNVMLIHDNSGMTVVADEKNYSLLENSGVVKNMCWAPHNWRAFEIHLGAGEESQRIVSHISSCLSDRDISILNFTTFETDLILVQEYQVGLAQACFAEFARYGVEGMLEQMEEKREELRKQNNAEPLKSSLNTSNGRRAGDATEKTVRFAEDVDSKTNAYLQILPKPLVLVQIGRTVLKESHFAIMKQLLTNIDRSVITAPPLLGCVDVEKQSLPSEGINDESREREATNRDRRLSSVSQPSVLNDITQMKNSFFWSYLSSKDEVSLVIEESSMREFPEGSLLECGKSWTGIKLCGKDIPFHATGVVKTMSKPYEAGIHILNMSTYSTNITLVKEEDVNDAVQKIREALNGPETLCIG